MKAHASFKLCIDNQVIDLKNLKGYNLGAKWQLSILNFVRDFLNDNASVKVQTSGSTGKPKEIELLKSRMRNSAEMTSSFLDLKEKDKALLCLSADYIAGKMMLVRALILGLEIHCVEPDTSFLKDINQHFAFSAMVPMQAMANIQWLSKIDMLIIGGGSLSQTDTDTLIRTNHNGLYQTFGMTETISHVALKRISNPFYSALKDISFFLSEKQTLVINAPLLLDNPITTNDLVELKNNTSFKWLGRADNIVNSGGYKIIPEKIEAEIGKVVNTSFFVYGIDDTRYGEKLILFIENEKHDLNSTQLKGLNLNKFEIPKEIHGLKEFARTETGKVHRKKTVEIFLANI